MTGALFIDLSKAFDTISHYILLNTLDSYGVSGPSLDLIADYLFNRSQQVSYLGTLSSPQPIFCGVPQGSILGPLLFIIYFNGATTAVVKSKIIMYADDTVLFVSGKTIPEIQDNLQKDFDSISAWLSKNELIINSKKGKTEAMLFGTHQRLWRQNDQLSINHNGVPIHLTDLYIYLGILLTPSLNMTNHILESIKKATSRVRLLRKTRYFMDIDTAHLIYQSMILPLFTYCSFTLYGSTPQYLKDRISQLERRAERIIGRTVPKREIVLRKRICLYVHRCMNKLNTCGTFDDYFVFKSSTPRIRTKGSTLLVPRIKLEAARATFKFQGVKLFNLLPMNTRTEKDFDDFKRNLNSDS